MSSDEPIDSIPATLIFNKLCDELDASEDDRDSFVYHLGQGCREFRFMGCLGFGGKFYNCNRRWYVGCYPEDETPERLEKINRVNVWLTRFKEPHP